MLKQKLPGNFSGYQTVIEPVSAMLKLGTTSDISIQLLNKMYSLSFIFVEGDIE